MRPSKQSKYKSSIKSRKQEVNGMVQKSVEQILQGKIDINVRYKAGSTDYRENENPDMVEDDQDIYQLKHLSLEVKVNYVQEDHKE